MAAFLTDHAGQQRSHVGPNPVGPEPVMPGPDSLPGAEVGGEVAPSTARLLKIQAGIDHLTQVRRDWRVDREKRSDRVPLGVGQVAWIAPPIVFVFFAMFRRPHGLPSPSAGNAHKAD